MTQVYLTRKSHLKSVVFLDTFWKTGFGRSIDLKLKVAEGMEPEKRHRDKTDLSSEYI